MSSSSSSDSDSPNEFLAPISLDHDSIRNRLSYIQNRVADADPQKLFYLFNNQYLSPLNAYQLKKSLLSLELSDLHQYSFCIRFNVYHIANQIDTPTCINWARITYLQICKLLGILNKIFNISDNWDYSHCSLVFDRRESHDFHFFLYLFKLQLEGAATASDYDVITEELPLPPPNLLSLCWAVLTRDFTLSQQNQICKMLLTRASTRLLSPPIGTLHVLPFLNETKLFREAPVVFRFNYIGNSVLNFPFSQVHSEIFREFPLCPYCDLRVLTVPGDFCLHTCKNCQTLCRCLPCSSCESNTVKTFDFLTVYRGNRTIAVLDSLDENRTNGYTIPSIENSRW